MKDIKIKKELEKIMGHPIKPKCPECGEPMINSVDSKTKEISQYLWETNCGHLVNLRLCIG